MKTRFIFVLLTIFVTPLLALAHSGGESEGFFGHHMGFFGGFGWIMMILFAAFVIFVIMAFSRSLLPAKNNTGLGALQILEERYARGEIDLEAYKNMKRTLR